jgi:hypothetical protein
MFSKKSLKILRGFDEQFRVASDFDFAIRLASLGKFESTTNLIGYYLDSNEGASTRKDGVQAQEREAIYARYGAFHKSDPTLLHNIRKFDLDRVFVHDRIYTLRECTSNLDYIFEKNHSEESLSQWVTRWKTRNNNNRANTLIFYIKKRKMRKIIKFFIDYFRKGARRP